MIDGRVIGDFRKGGEETKFAFADEKFYANYTMGRDQFEIMQLDPVKADPEKSKNPPTEIGASVGVVPSAGGKIYAACQDGTIRCFGESLFSLWSAVTRHRFLF